MPNEWCDLKGLRRIHWKREREMVLCVLKTYDYSPSLCCEALGVSNMRPLLKRYKLEKKYEQNRPVRGRPKKTKKK